MNDGSSEALKIDPTNRAAAILVMCVGVLFLVLNDAMAKWLGARYDPFQIIFVRSVLALPVVIALVCILDSPKALISKRIRVHLLRGVLGVSAGYAFILSLQSLPLAEATALIFASPIIIAALSAPLLKEHVSRKAAAVIAIGFLGVLIILRPGAETFQPAALLAVAAALIYALVMLSARWIHKRDSMWTMMFYMTLSSVFLTAFTAFSSWPTFHEMDFILFPCMAVAGTLGLTLISQAFRMAPAAVVAPYDYTALLWASFLGWLIWGVVPEIWTYVGALVIIGSAIYLTRAEVDSKT